MDRSWVSIKNRTCKEYENGVEAFLRFALEYGCDSTRMICPCKDCCYSRLINVDEVREHLIYRGINSDYTRWIWHGEKSVATDSTASEEFVHGTNFDVLEDYDDRLNDMIDDIEGDLANDPDKFLDMVNNAKMPLYSGCTRFTKLSALLKLYNLKARHGWSDSSFGDMLELIKEILPKDNSLPVSTYEKELDMCHVSIYLRYLFETRCKGVDDIFGFLSPTLVSPHANSGSLKDRATYIANSMKGNIENKLFFAPYKIGPRWVLLVLNPHYGYAYWIDPAQKGQELDADKLVDLSFTFKFMDLEKKKPRKQILWHIVKCPQHQTVIDSGYYVLRFIKEIMRRNSISVPKIWYGKKESLSESEIDEIRKEWIEYLLQLMF